MLCKAVADELVANVMPKL